MLVKTKLKLASSALSVGAFIAFGVLSQGVAHAATGTYYKWTGASTATAGLGGCTSNCWSVANNWDVSTDGGTTYVAASSAPNSTDNSGAGDNLVFDNTSLSSATTVHNDITNLVVDTLTSQGTGVYPDVFTLAGNAFSLVNGELGVPDAVPQLTINNNVTFSASQTYGQTGINSDEYNFQGTLTVPTSVTLTAASPINITTLAGGGSLILQGPTSGNYPQYHSIFNASTLSGSIEIQSGALLTITTPSALGTAALTIDSGGQLSIDDGPSTPVASDTITIPNAITLAGNGTGVSQQNQGAIIAGLYNNTAGQDQGNLTVTLSGTVTLTGDTQLASVYATVVTYNLTGTFNANGHALTAVAASQPTYGTTTIEVNGTPLVAATTASAPTAAAPKTPDTGFGLVAAHPAETLGLSGLSAFGLLLIGLRSRRSLKRR